MMKIKRKYKKLPENIFQFATQYHQMGKLEEAEFLYTKIIRQQPNNADALHLLGVLHSQRGDHDAAISYIQKALKINHSSTAYHYNLGNAFKRKGQLDDAILSYQNALQLDTGLADIHYNLGCAFDEKQQIEDAIISFQKALKLNPNLYDALYNLGNIFHRKGEYDKAMDFYKKALDINPKFPDLYSTVGTYLHTAGQIDEAIVYYQKALQFQADSSSVYNNLGVALKAKGQFEEALKHFQKAIHRDPLNAEAYCNIGIILGGKGKYEESLSHYLKAIQINPTLPDTYCNLGILLKEHGNLSDAEAYFKSAMQLDNLNPLYYSNFLLLMLYNPLYDPQTIFSEHLQFSKQFEDPLQLSIVSHTNPKTLNRRLKVGYVSPDFRKHSVSYFIETVLANHDKLQFEVFCYENSFVQDEVTNRLRSFADHWRNIAGISDEKAEELLRDDEIDILIDLSGHSANNRLLLFARKPAPIQASWIGYPATTGLSAMDYRIVDNYTDPAGMHEQFYTEDPIRMPECFLCYLPDNDSPDICDLPALTSGHITFGSFNNLAKVSRETILLWSRILQSVPGSRLIIKSRNLASRSTCDGILNMFAQHGVAPGVISLHSLEISTRDHLNVYNQVDIGLDTFPYNGTTTTCEALWMGVPVVTLAGNSHVSRVGTSLLSNVGLQEFVAETPDEYVSIAAALANDLHKIRSLRDSLREKMAQSPLTDSKRFIRNLETSYRAIWGKWCQSDEIPN